MEQAPETATLLIMAGIIVLAVFYLRMAASFFPQVLRLYRFIATKIHEYQALDRGDFLTLLIDAGLSHEEAMSFHSKFYVRATPLERCVIKLYITRSIVHRKMQ